MLHKIDLFAFYIWFNQCEKFVNYSGVITTQLCGDKWQGEVIVWFRVSLVKIGII